MHDLYYKGRIHTRKNFVKAGFNTKRAIKLGTQENPLTLLVNDQSRETEIAAIVASNDLFANITVDAAQSENISELDGVLNTPKTTTFDKTPNRNDPCVCGSGKKYKKCCA